MIINLIDQAKSEGELEQLFHSYHKVSNFDYPSSNLVLKSDIVTNFNSPESGSLNTKDRKLGRMPKIGMPRNKLIYLLRSF